MTSASESRAALELVTTSAVAEAVSLPRRFNGSPDARRAALLEAVPALIAYYSDGTSALAADFYEEERELARVTSIFTATPIVVDRVEKQRRAVVWAVEPLFDPSLPASVESRLAEVVQLETARPYRDTILGNRSRDPEAVGWKRLANPGACGFCRMLAGRGTVYRSRTVRFASHANCYCSAVPVFGKHDVGEPVSEFQYMASIRQQTPAQKARLREYLKANYPDDE